MGRTSSKWSEHKHFWEHRAKQGTQEWLDARIGRITGSNSGAMADKSHFKKPKEMGLIIAGVVTEEFDEESLRRMNHGHQYEPKARAWYEKKYGCQATERGLCVSKTDNRFAASVDGDIIGTDGILEIKCPQKMYRPIEKYIQNVQNGWIPPANYCDHIWDTHICQMQQGMYVLNKKWCDYVVYCTSTEQIFTQRIHFDPVYWAKHMQILDKNYGLYIEPYLKQALSVPCRA